jgi:hypothetical protein
MARNGPRPIIIHILIHSTGRWRLSKHRFLGITSSNCEFSSFGTLSAVVFPEIYNQSELSVGEAMTALIRGALDFSLNKTCKEEF